MPTGEPLFRIARDVLKATGEQYARTWAPEIYGRRKELEPIDPFTGGQIMAARFIPYIDAYIEAGGNAIRAELGFQPADDWLIRSPQIIEAARTATLDLCQETVDKFLVDVGTGLNEIRREVATSIEQGETLGNTVNRVSKWLDDESRWRARRVAVTESARAYNAGNMAATNEADFVAGYKLILSADACPMCHMIARLCPVIPKGGSFGANGKNPTYRNLKMPPFHPNCRCTIGVVFDDEIPKEWPRPVQPGDRGYLEPSDDDYSMAEEGGYETVRIGNAKTLTGQIVPWSEDDAGRFRGDHHCHHRQDNPTACD